MAQRSEMETRARPVPGGFGWYRFDAISLDGRYILVASWHSGFLFSPRYYDEILELKERDGVQPDEEGIDLADPTNHGAFTFALYDRGRTSATVIVEAPLVRGGSDPWFPLLHSGEPGIEPDLPASDTTLGVGENRVVRGSDGTYRIEFADRSRWMRTLVEGELDVRPLTTGSDVIPLADQESGDQGGHAWQIVASRTEVKGTIRWRDPILRRRHRLEFQGLGYLDRSVGRLPLSPNLGRWLWGRYQGSERTIAYYRLDPANVPLSASSGQGPDALAGAREFLYYGDREGGKLLQDGGIDPHHIRRNRWGMPHPLEIRGRRVEPRWEAKVIRIVDRGPFFVRCLSRLRCEDPALDEVIGISECFLPARWDVPLYRLVTRGRIRRGA